jgi:hypothetical protein
MKWRKYLFSKLITLLGFCFVLLEAEKINKKGKIIKIIYYQ